MYATINLPGSTHFHYFGPDTKRACQAWIDTTVERLLWTQLVTSTLPRQLVSNKCAATWAYRDGTPVLRPYEGANATDCPRCGKPDWAPTHAEGCTP